MKKKAILYLTVILFFCSQLSYGLTQNTTYNVVQGHDSEESLFDQRNSFSHTVLGEFQTAWWCQYCKFAHQALQNIYNGGEFPFYYITLETSKNTNAMARAQELGYGGLPRVFFDGGYRLNLGAPNIPAAQNAYNISIQECGDRTVADIDLFLSVTWLGSATIQVDVSATNNDIAEYHGRLRMYVTEIASTMGWVDGFENPYTHAFLDYALNTAVSIPAGETWEETTTWNGYDYSDGYGNSFGNITEDNVMVIAAMFDAQDAYVDETTAATPGAANNPPYVPSNPSPAHGSIGIGISPLLTWTGGDPDGDVCTYDVYFGTTNPPPKVVGNQSSTTYTTGILAYESTYYWRIVAWDSHGALTNGPLWWFTTLHEPPPGNQPPYVPHNPNPPDESTDVSVVIELSWTGGDPDPGDIVTYDVYFGTQNPPPLLNQNQTSTTYSPGSLEYNTVYYWMIVAWDQIGDSSTSDIWMFTTQELDTTLTIDITRPKEGNIYLFDTQPIKRLRAVMPLVIGRITIEAEILEHANEIEKVEFYIDDKLQETVNNSPYQFVWKDRTFTSHTIKVVVYDTLDNTASAQVTVRKLF